MSPSVAWRLLGLEPTGDRRAVKRAYAAKLKAIDPDKDIGGFLALRDALESAQRAADRIADAPPSREQGAHFPIEQVGAPKPLVPTTGPRQAGDDSAVSGLAHVKEAAKPEPDIRDNIAAILSAQMSDPSEPESLIVAMRQLLADERMQRVEFSSKTEDWLAFILVRTIPRSDPVIPLVTKHFNWMAELRKANRRPMVTSAAQRAVDLDCIESLSEARHPWHDAFTKLREPSPKTLSLKDRLQLKPHVAELLASLRYHNPMVERLFEPAHVKLWDEAVAKSPVRNHQRKPGISWYGWMLIGWCGLTIGRFVMAAMG